MNRLRKIFLTSRFLTISIIIHVLLVIFLGGKMFYHRQDKLADFTGDESSFVANEEKVQAPPPAQTSETPQFNVTPTAAPQLNAITAVNATQPTFTMPEMINPQIMPDTKSLDQAAAVQTPQFSGGMSMEVAKGVANFTGGWVKKGSNPGTALRSREFQFTAYLAKYGDPNDPERASGDWNSTVWTQKDGAITGGSLPNLLYVIGKFSSEKIKATPQPMPLDISDWEAIASAKPPFILFTGHRNFVLTDKEVENLRKYIMLGGCVWGDSSLPGRRSRFDIAFRREMRRVIPDIDKDWEALPADHPIFTKAYYPEISSVPAGMNFYKEPVYALKVYGEIAVLYTANDYGDMWQIGLDDKRQVDLRRDEHGRWVAVNWGMWTSRDIYFRNLTLESLSASYKFGTNIIVHLLTRWEDKVRNVPQNL